MAKSKITPMMAQYRRLKAELSDDVLLLFRMGDFYEIFFDDAVRGSRLLGITLTRRQGVPMAGIPYHALQEYLPRILAEGVKAAIAEQMEDPKTAKGLVKREITRILTPGTIVEGATLVAGRSNFIVGIAAEKGEFGLAGLDISTGDFRITEVAGPEALEGELHRLQPAECLLPESLHRQWTADGFPDGPRGIVWTPVDDWIFDQKVSTDLLKRHFQVASLDGFGCRDYPLAVLAAGGLLHYAQNSLRRDADHINRLSPYPSAAYAMVDRVTQRNLELTEPLFRDSKDATLLSVLNRTVTPMGSRMMREWILRPLLDVAAIEARQDAIAAMVNDQLLLVELRETLGVVKDLERTIARLNVGSANGRDLLVLQRGLAAIPALRTIIDVPEGAAMLRELNRQLQELPEIPELIGKAIVDEPPLTVKEGGIIRDGYNPLLDDLRKGATEGKAWIAALQKQEQERTGIKSLKVRFNKVFGYYIEVSKANLEAVPEHYIRKQTLVNAERFITPELKEIEDKVLGAEDKAKALEYELFQAVRTEVVAQTAAIQQSAAAVACIDVIGALAESALQEQYVRPEVHEGLEISITDGRHPVVDHMMREERFVPNDTRLDGECHQMIILTGPNMSGKSTYIRQVALLTVMAQIGSFIPAARARVGLADRIFTRVGASDDLTRGQSTFMVEMLETANIVNNASPRSLIILDEIGRGTSTYDGLSIAWAVAEYIHNTPRLQSRTLFATHYHELTQLAMTMRGITNASVAVHEADGAVTFLHRIVPGAADRSYGIHVARLAGLPDGVIERANEVLANLEGNAVDQATEKPKLAKRRRRPHADPQQPLLFEL